MTHTLTPTRFLSEVKACLFLAIPLAGAQLAQSATGFVDTVMMGLLGSQNLAAGAIGATSFTACLIIGSGIVSAVSPLAAEAFGAGKTDAIGQIVRQGLLLALLLAMPITLLLWLGGDLLVMLGQAASTADLADGYLKAIAWGYFPGLGVAVLRNFVAALSITRPIIVTIVLGTLLNVVGNYILMFGTLGFPALGLAGIGWASVLSLWSMFIGLGIYILKQSRFKPYRVFHHLGRFQARVFGELVQVGLPIGVLAAVETGLFTVTTFLMGRLGTTTLAAHQIALQSAAITFTVSLGISVATTVRVGQLIGQNKPRDARLAGYIGIALGGVFMGGMALVFWVIPTQIVSLYIDVTNPANTTVVTLAKSLLGVAAMFQIADGVQVAAVGALRGLKDTRVPMAIGVLSYWCIGLTSGYWLGLEAGLGGVGLWWGLAIGLAVAAVILTWRFSTAKQWQATSAIPVASLPSKNN